MVLPILFLIYISGVFNKVSETSRLVTSFLFVDKLGFIASSSSIKEIVKALQKIALEVIEWEELNTVTSNTSKTKAIFFSKSYRQCLNKQLQKVKIKVGAKKILFNKKTT